MAHGETQGTIASVSSKKIGQDERWLHRLRVGGRYYSYFTKDCDCLFRPGDFIRFHWVSKRAKHCSYRNIRGDPELVRAREDSAQADGYVYVLTNVSMPNLVKIGMTTRTPEERCAELSQNTSIPTPFNVAFFQMVVGNAKLVEATVHEEFANLREGKEFYRTSVNRAKQVISEVYSLLYPGQSGASNAWQVRVQTQQAKQIEAASAPEEPCSETEQNAAETCPILHAYEEAVVNAHRVDSPSVQANPQASGERPGISDLGIFVAMLGVMIVAIAALRSCLLAS